jgi:hypothetical protein
MAYDSINNYKVRLVPVSKWKSGDITTIRQSGVVFEATPNFTESRSAEYEALAPIHMPGSIQVYKRTNSRTFSIGAHLLSRNVDDARTNMRYLQLLRSWMLPYFGKTDTLHANQQANRDSRRQSGNSSGQTQEERITSEGVQLRGAPPDVLFLYAYSANQDGQRSMSTPIINIARVPVVMTNLEITYPEDVDYIPVAEVDADGQLINMDKAQPFPRKMDVTISLIETHSPREYEEFDLLSYKMGNLTGF